MYILLSKNYYRVNDENEFVLNERFFADLKLAVEEETKGCFHVTFAGYEAIQNASYSIFLRESIESPFGNLGDFQIQVKLEETGIKLYPLCSLWGWNSWLCCRICSWFLRNRDSFTLVDDRKVKKNFIYEDFLLFFEKDFRRHYGIYRKNGLSNKEYFETFKKDISDILNYLPEPLTALHFGSKEVYESIINRETFIFN